MLNKKSHLGVFIFLASVVGLAALPACAVHNNEVLPEPVPTSTSSIHSQQDEEFLVDEESDVSEVESSESEVEASVPVPTSESSVKFVFVSATVVEGARTLESGYGRIPQRLELSQSARFVFDPSTQEYDRSRTINSLDVSLYSRAAGRSASRPAAHFYGFDFDGEVAEGVLVRDEARHQGVVGATCRSLLGIASRSPLHMTGNESGSLEISSGRRQAILRFSCNMGRGRIRQYELVYGNPTVAR